MKVSIYFVVAFFFYVKLYMISSQNDKLSKKEPITEILRFSKLFLIFRINLETYLFKNVCDCDIPMPKTKHGLKPSLAMANVSRFQLCFLHS